jgi:uncharacterized tellurite resistance protein B-like protein|tara:strand:- start:131 stop:550 length:420 start_codon:yes stop_codon:yes gene_type:complete
MFSFKKKSIKKEKPYLVNIAALLIHVAKIDENFTYKEEKIIEKSLLELGAKKENLALLIEDSKKIEKESNQILDFTREIKKMNESEKIKIIETLWRVIYSNKDEDMYESNLMRRLSGLLYINNKTMGDIKEKIKKEYLE